MRRRELLGGAAAAVAAGGLVPGWAGAAARPQRGAEQRLLVGLLKVEHRLSEAYRRVLASGVLNTLQSAEVSSLLAQEEEHIGALTRQLVLRGGSFAPTPQLAGGGVPPIGAADGLSQLISAEGAAQAAYYDAIAKLGEPELVTLASQILASEAQHWTLLKLLADGRNPLFAVPNAFVQGSG